VGDVRQEWKDAEGIKAKSMLAFRWITSYRWGSIYSGSVGDTNAFHRYLFDCICLLNKYVGPVTMIDNKQVEGSEIMNQFNYAGSRGVRAEVKEYLLKSKHFFRWTTSY